VSSNNLLYLSCHSTLEYDELRIFSDLGLDWFSVGSYMDPLNPLEDLRPPLSHNVNQDLIAEFKTLNPKYKYNDPIVLTQSFVDKFDIIIVSHFPHYLQNQWPLIKDKMVVYSPVGQSNNWLEGQLKTYKADGMRIVRVSAAEQAMGVYAGHDAIIRPIVDADEYNNWNGQKENVVTVNKWMQKRALHCLFYEYDIITKGLPRKLYGQNNEDIPFSNGTLSYDELKAAYRDNRVSLSMGTKPAPFTYTFMEALMTGCPVVTVGPGLGRGAPVGTYEAYSFIENGVDGFWSDDLKELRQYIELLLKDYDLAKQISVEGRKKALKLFDRSVAVRDWKNLFESSFGLSL